MPVSTVSECVWQWSFEGNICVSSGAKIKKWKCVKLNDCTKIIIKISYNRYFLACFALNNEKEPNKDEIDEENLLQITKNFIFGQWPRVGWNYKFA